MSNLSKFEELLKLNINDKVEKKKSGNNQLTYLSWAFAIGEMEKAYPEWEYSILEFNGLPYQFDPMTGYMVWTEIKAGGKTKKMWLPVMDGSNKAMKDKPYEYTTKFGKKYVEAASMFDINKTIMRCLVKNIAMFGLGLYIYAGEDLPEGEEKSPKDSEEKPKNQFSGLAVVADEDMKTTLRDANEKSFQDIKSKLENANSLEEMSEIWKEKTAEIKKLNKYAGDLYSLLIECKNVCKSELETGVQMANELGDNIDYTSAG